MPKLRGLLTEREREILRQEAEVSRNYVYQIRSRVRDKIEALSTDADILKHYQPDLYEELNQRLER